MQTLKYTSGKWKIEARVQDAGDNKRLAVISALTDEGNVSPESRHTVVFDHIPGCDEVEEMKAQIDRALIRSH